MVDNDTQTLIDEVVGHWISQSRAFTTYEVSIEVQIQLKEDHKPFVRHQEMRDYYQQCQPLRDEVQYGSYKMTLVDVGASEQANLYHPDTYDPSQYKPLPRQGKAKPVTTAPVVMPIVAPPANMIYAPSSTSPSPSVPGACMVNQGDELWISSQHLADIGLHPGDTFEIYQDGSNVVLAEHAPPGVQVFRQMIVEQKGNSRLSRQARQLLGFTKTNFKVVVENNDRIVVSEM